MKDPRYNIVREKILNGEINEWKQIFKHIPAELVKTDVFDLSGRDESLHCQQYWSGVTGRLTEEECMMLAKMLEARYRELVQGGKKNKKRR